VAADDPFTSWRELREREGPREQLAGLLGPVARRIEHVGSTSVPGLAAKPIVDIQVSVADMDDEDGYLLPCEAAGLQLRFRDQASAAGRDAYVAAKREAARLWADQGAAYTEAKSNVILGLLVQAEAWAVATGWVI